MPSHEFEKFAHEQHSRLAVSDVHVERRGDAPVRLGEEPSAERLSLFIGKVGPGAGKPQPPRLQQLDRLDLLAVIGKEIAEATPLKTPHRPCERPDLTRREGDATTHLVRSRAVVAALVHEQQVAQSVVRLKPCSRTRWAIA